MEVCYYINIINSSFRNTPFQSSLTLKVYPDISTIPLFIISFFKKTQQKSIEHLNFTATLLQKDV